MKKKQTIKYSLRQAEIEKAYQESRICTACSGTGRYKDGKCSACKGKEIDDEQ